MLSQQTRPGLADAVYEFAQALNGLGVAVYISYAIDGNGPARYGIAAAERGITFEALAAVEAFEKTWGCDAVVRTEVVAEMESRIRAKRLDDLIAKYVETAEAHGVDLIIRGGEPVEGMRGVVHSLQFHVRCATPASRKGLSALAPIERSIRAEQGGWDELVEQLAERKEAKLQAAFTPAPVVASIQAVA